ncbi:MAG: TetR/AcrR family transcriptional regulator [Candidatus Eremiobacteraeota bacterium]|nr:TetR/AcrR family transcriptional regulator [Candidatus Eremiobacteraeota bacterium]
MAIRGSGDATRRSVLAAAAEIVAIEGAAKLTLDAVAERVGLSKGGILHHFATKDSLISAMIEDVVTQFEADLQKHMQGESGPGSFARAFLRACLDREGALTRTLRVSAGIVAAVAINSQLLGPLRRRYTEWCARLENDGIDPAIAELVRSAADGLWLGNVFELGLPSVALRKRVFAKLIELTTVA